ncbi:sulfotransferase ssu-1-like [Dermacentor albipictus]|uniref:sulfotransferase ssu-1-like n=1 Tax=Dermacentor albipictus TaxID=60249 RepID=UPI0031FD658F
MPGNSNREGESSAFISKFYPDENTRSALSYQPQADDIFVVTNFPLCGDTWVQLIIYHILHKRAPPSPLMERATHLPHLELQGSDAVQAMPRPGSIRTHLPFHLVPQADCAKYIYVARNPYDCCAQFFEQISSAQGKSVDEALKAFPSFFDQFVEGRAFCGDYLTDLVSWYKRRFDDNVLFLTYEDLKYDNMTTVLRIADFLDEEGQYGEWLRRNGKFLRKICAETQYEGVWECVEEHTKLKMKEAAALPDEGKPDWVKQLQKASVTFGQLFGMKCDEGKTRLSREDMFTPDMIKKLEERLKIAAGGSNHIMTLWTSIE